MKLTEGDKALIKRSLQVLKEASEMNPEDIVKLQAQTTQELGQWLDALKTTFEEGHKGAEEVEKKLVDFFATMEEFATQTMVEKEAAEQAAKEKASEVEAAAKNDASKQAAAEPAQPDAAADTDVKL